MLTDRTLDNLQTRFARLMAEYLSYQAKMKQRLARVEQERNQEEDLKWVASMSSFNYRVVISLLKHFYFSSQIVYITINSNTVQKYN